LRKGLTIKASVLLLAWLVIFFHNIIPHNHIYDSTQNCNNLVHSSFPCTSDNDGSLKFENERPGLQVCHLSNSPFNNLNAEVFLAYFSRDINFAPCRPACETIDTEGNFYVSDYLYGASFLRAPPVF